MTRSTTPPTRTNHFAVALSAFAVGLLVSFSASAVPFGPTPYASTANSPFFDGTQFTVAPGGYLHLETFDDHVLNGAGPIVPPPNPAGNVHTNIPSGAITTPQGFAMGFTGASGSSIDQVGLAGGCPAGGITISCDVWFSVPNDAPPPATPFNNPIQFTFNAGPLGQLPNAAGIAFTDGLSGAGLQRVQFFDGGGNLIATIGPTDLEDANTGTTADDFFFGFFNESGVISRIDISHTGGSLEVDHLQFGVLQQVITPPPPPPPGGVPEPGSLALLALGVAGLWLRRRAAH